MLSVHTNTHHSLCGESPERAVDPESSGPVVGVGSDTGVSESGKYLN